MFLNVYKGQRRRVIPQRISWYMYNEINFPVIRQISSGITNIWIFEDPVVQCSNLWFKSCIISLITLIILKEPKWLSGGSHTSVFNGGLVGSHFGSPQEPVLKYGGMAPSREPFWLSLYSRRWSCFGSISYSKWLSLESQNGANWSERDLTQACSSDDSGCNGDMEILDRQNSSNPVKLILW